MGWVPVHRYITANNPLFMARIPIINLIRPNTPPEILANWDIPVDEWKKFTKWEYKDRKESAIILVLIVMILGTILLRITRMAPWWAAVGVPFFIGTLVAWLRYLYVTGPLKSKSETNEVTITPFYASFNGKRFPFIDEKKSIKAVKILELPDPKVLEITYEWSTRNGMTFEELHIPIPKGKLGEAVRLLDRLKAS